MNWLFNLWHDFKLEYKRNYQKLRDRQKRTSNSSSFSSSSSDCGSNDGGD